MPFVAKKQIEKIKNDFSYVPSQQVLCVKYNR